MTDGRLAWIIVVAILVIDQIIKVEVKTSMCLGESIRLTDWFYITFIENKGMAYGMSFMPKILLSTMRIIAICFIGWYINLVLKEKGRTLYVVVLLLLYTPRFIPIAFTFSTSAGIPFGKVSLSA